MTAATPTILATCGGMIPGTWTDAVYGPLLDFAIELADVSGRRPRVFHVNTAGGDQRVLEGQELEAARLTHVDASHLRLFPHPNVADLEAHLLSQDVIWVSGGSLVNLLAVWRAHGLPDILHRAWQAGVVLAGGSAGGLVWHSGGTTSSFGPDIRTIPDGLGFLPGSLAVHYDSDPGRRPSFHAAIASGEVPDGYALEEGVGVRYSGVELVEVVAEAAGRRAFRVERTTDGVAETTLVPRLLPIH